jgi:hypothetical protein
MRIVHNLALAAMLGGFIAVAWSIPAHAEVSAQDGYNPDGSHKLSFELAPYAWIPAVAGDVKLGRGASINISQGMPSASTLTSVLRGAFVGFGLVRYGPWSGEIDIQYIATSNDKGVGPDVFGFSRSLNVDTSLVRVAPGVGYQVFKGDLGSVPTTVDARVGFAFMTTSATLDLDRFGPLGRERTSRLSDSSSFAQPWTGLRASFYPWTDWRFELGAMVQGFGAGGNGWGWGASATATWAANDWLNVIEPVRNSVCGA